MSKLAIDDRVRELEIKVASLPLLVKFIAAMQVANVGAVVALFVAFS